VPLGTHDPGRIALRERPALPDDDLERVTAAVKRPGVKVHPQEAAMKSVVLPPAPWARGDWIICVGAERPVVGGIVRCPLRGSVEISTCIDCRLLETVAAERRLDRACGVGTDLAR
jgi:hypothetical protein